MSYPNNDTFITALIAVCLMSIGSVQAQTTESSSDQNAEQEIESGSQATADVRIRQAGTTRVTEFQQQGKTYRVEIAPKNTPAYILSDQDGNGNLNSSDTSIDHDLVLPEWTIGNW